MRFYKLKIAFVKLSQLATYMLETEILSAPSKLKTESINRDFPQMKFILERLTDPILFDLTKAPS